MWIRRLRGPRLGSDLEWNLESPRRWPGRHYYDQKWAAIGASSLMSEHYDGRRAPPEADNTVTLITLRLLCALRSSRHRRQRLPGVMRLRSSAPLLLAAALAMALMASCATTIKSSQNPEGVYRFDAWSGERSFSGTLTIFRIGESWTGRLSFDDTGALRTVKFSLEDGNLRLTAEGREFLVRVNASFSGSSLNGSWSSGNRRGSFRARKTSWAGLGVNRAFPTGDSLRSRGAAR